METGTIHPGKLEDLSIRELRKKLTTKSNYAELVVDKAGEYGFQLTKFSVYNAIQRNGGEHEDVIKKVLISIIRERESRLAAII
jgi:hypothetical protein